MTTAPTTGSDQQIEVTLPNLGDFTDIPVIEVHVSEGDTVAENDPVVTLESDKATMEVPSSSAGTVQRVHVAVGDNLNVGDVLLTLSSADAGPDPAGGSGNKTDTASQTADVVQQESSPEQAAKVSEAAQTSAEAAAPDASAGPPAGGAAGSPAAAAENGLPHAGPGVRRLARELEVDLTTIAGTGPKGRIIKDDLRRALAPAPSSAAPPAASGTGIPEIPPQDFAAYGPIETRELPRITKLSGPFLHRSWLNVPHVTHNDEADITDLDAYRKELDVAAKEQGYRITLLAFLMKASVSALREHPQCNSSLSPDQGSLIYKSYYHLGIAVDTPGGLVVPVIRDVDRKGIDELSRELGEVSSRARAGKLSAADLQGGTFTISSLGGIGGTSFTPIVNAPEVAILGVVRAKTAPVWNGRKFKPRLMLPLSLSYDHRVIDGALAARFTRRLGYLLEDVRRLAL